MIQLWLLTLCHQLLLVFNQYLSIPISDINECASDPCVNGGICYNELDRYRCECQPGYNGVNCETSKSPWWFMACTRGMHSLACVPLLAHGNTLGRTTLNKFSTGVHADSSLHPMWQYFESFVDKNSLDKDKI